MVNAKLCCDWCLCIHISYLYIPDYLHSINHQKCISGFVTNYPPKRLCPFIFTPTKHTRNISVFAKLSDKRGFSLEIYCKVYWPYVFTYWLVLCFFFFLLVVIYLLFFKVLCRNVINPSLQNVFLIFKKFIF